MIKIAIFEDHIFLLNSLKNELSAQSNIEIVFTTDKKVDLFEFVNINPELDILIVDVLAEDVLGTEVFEFVCKNYPKIKVIAFTSLKSSVLVENLIGMGVKGYVHKTQPINDLIEAINSVSKNKFHLPSDFSFLKNKINIENKKLTEREIEIIHLMSLENSSAEIAQKMKISTRTVDTHKKNIFNKLNVKSALGMMREAAKLGLLG